MSRKIELFILFINLLKFTVSEEILGCGGFINSHADIDFSKVHIKLLTKSGSLKDDTECAPNNGYYFIPLYDKGSYILKVDPPRGWSFEPTEVEIEVDGSTDICSTGKDINFIFKGFGINGRVASSSNTADNKKTKSISKTGPSGVTISLYKDKVENGNFVDKTITSKGGIFSFTPIQPGNYILVASHSVWTFEKDSVEVIVKEGNTELPEDSFIVFGYDVTGKVTSKDDQQPSGVSLILYGNGRFKDCSTEKLFEDNKILCHVKSDKNGKFVFPSLTNGEYRIVPHHVGTKTKFEVQPKEITFKVEDNSVILSEDFKIIGFTISGRVVMSNNEKYSQVPVANAKIYLSDKFIATSDKDGYYTVDKMKPGQYTLKIEAENLQFDEKIVKISANSPILPTISPSSYKVCGSVTHSTKGTSNQRKVIVENSMATFRREIDIDSKTGQFCLYLLPGKYQFIVVVTAEERSKGLQFFPLQQTIDVTEKPIDNVTFLQLKAKLTGIITCMKESPLNCKKVSVTLKVLDGLTVKTINAVDGNYEFNDILPGHYEVLVDTDVFCWENPSQKISVTSERVIIPPFKQTGFSVTFISSHDSAVEFYDPIKSKKVALTLPVGSTRHCVSSPGEYKFTPKSCHIYPQETYSWNTINQSPLILTTNQHRHKGRIIVPITGTTSRDDKKHDIEVNIEIENKDISDTSNQQGKEKKIIKALVKKEAHDNAYRYTFEFYGNADNTYIITPLSDIILFNQASIKTIGTNNCNNDIASFNGHVGEIVAGKIQPPMEGVNVQIFGKNKEIPLHTIITDKNGLYSVGPLTKTIEYSVKADKPGYIINGPDDNGIFFAHKLAEIIVDVNDQADNIALQGVLLSLSGGDRGGYRKNSVTGQQGQLIFNGLSPGEYYLRPMMKEYKFDPPSKMITVTEGATLKIKLSGNRVAFSAYGIVTSLNGEPEAGIVLEAIGQLPNCANFQEETTTEDNGKFRIRGLEPKCSYTIKLKSEVQSNSHIHRTSPTSIDVKVDNNDIHGLSFVTFYPISRMDLSVHVISNQPEHYRTLKLKLSRDYQLDSPIQTYNIDPQALQSAKFNSRNNPGFLIHFQPLPSNNKKYFLQLESSLSPALYKFKNNPIYFEANSSFRTFQIEFNAERKIDQTEMSQSSLLVLPILLIMTIAFFNREILFNWFTFTIEQWTKKVPISRAIPQTIPIDSRADDIIVEQIMNINKRKVKPRKV